MPASNLKDSIIETRDQTAASQSGGTAGRRVRQQELEPLDQLDDYRHFFVPSLILAAQVIA